MQRREERRGGVTMAATACSLRRRGGGGWEGERRKARVRERETRRGAADGEMCSDKTPRCVVSLAGLLQRAWAQFAGLCGPRSGPTCLANSLRCFPVGYASKNVGTDYQYFLFS